VLRVILEHTDLQPASDHAEPMERRPVTVVPRHGTPAVLRARQITPLQVPAAPMATHP